MEYILFILIILAASIFLYFSSPFISSTVQTDQKTALETTLGQIESVKSSLRDLELENSIGKISVDNYTLLKAEMIQDWEKLEQKAKALGKESLLALSSPKESTDLVSCPNCKNLVKMTETTKFCHVCGRKLMQILLVVCTFFSTAFFSLSSTLNALNIQVIAKNGTNPGKSVSGNVSLIELKEGMKPLKTIPLQGNKAEFSGLPGTQNQPYMVQLDYKGVVYSKTIPPLQKENVQTDLEVFENKAEFSSKIIVRTLAEIRYTEENFLHGIIIVYFLNEENYTYRNHEGGIYVKIPDGATLEQASVSVGSGTSDIQWLKLQAKQSQAGKGFLVLPYAVKPGERIFQTQFKLPYKDRKTLIDFSSAYSLETPMQLIAEPADLQLKLQSPPGFSLDKREDPTLKKMVYELGKDTKSYKVQVSGGTRQLTQSGSFRETEQAEVVIASPLSIGKKIGFAVSATIVFFGLIYLKRRQEKT